MYLNIPHFNHFSFQFLMYKQYKSENMPANPTLVTPEWLNKRIKEDGKNLRVLDASWHLPMMNRDSKAEYDAEHIPTAVQFDMNICYDDTSKYDLMIPSAEKFAQYVGGLGVTSDTEVVLYDSNANLGLFSAQRAWWMFRTFGHNNVSVLNGGLPKWKSENFKVTADVPKFPVASYVPRFNDSLLKTYEQIQDNLVQKEFQFIDARPPPRFNGTGNEPVPGN